MKNKNASTVLLFILICAICSLTFVANIDTLSVMLPSVVAQPAKSKLPDEKPLVAVSPILSAPSTNAERSSIADDDIRPAPTKISIAQVSTNSTRTVKTVGDILRSASTPVSITRQPTATNTPTILPTATSFPTRQPTQTIPAATPTAQSTPTQPPPPTAQPTPIIVQAILPPAAVTLTNFSHEWQTWNNCGPATLAMNLSFFGSTLNQADIGAILRQNPDDKNVTPQELVSFAQQQGFKAQLRVNGNSALMKTLLANDIPVLIETWLEPGPNGLGHYRLLTGYNDATQHWIAFDSYVHDKLVNDATNYEGIILPYAETDELWKVFNRTYLLIYSSDKADVVNAIFDNQLDQTAMWQQAQINAQTEIAANPIDPYAWFNLGSAQNALGRYADAAISFDQARSLGLPWRMLWYQFGPFEAYYQMQRYADLIALADATIANTQSIEEVHFWKGKALAATGDLQSAQVAWQQALVLNPSYTEVLNAIASAQ